MKLKRLSAEVFDRVADTTRLGDQARSMARAVLVDGRMQAAVAKEYGMTNQRVNLAVAAIERAYKQVAVPGVSIVRVEMELPETIVLELNALVEALRQCPDSQAVESVIDTVITASRRSRTRLMHRSMTPVCEAPAA